VIYQSGAREGTLRVTSKDLIGGKTISFSYIGGGGEEGEKKKRPVRRGRELY